jgi:flagellar assembly protein FliH
MPSSDEDSLLTRWEPPSFDPPKPPKPPKVPPVLYPTVEEVEAIRENAHKEAYELGNTQGFVEGRDAGYKEGKESGYREGYQQGYADAVEETHRLQDALGQLLEALTGMPEAIAQPLTEFSYEIATRLTANVSMERAPFVAAVQEALMRLPRPGENLYLRLNAKEVETWKKIVDDPGLPFNCTILIDADVKPGHAYVEVSGARIDVGAQARLALVRAALGLDRNSAELESDWQEGPDLNAPISVAVSNVAKEVQFEADNAFEHQGYSDGALLNAPLTSSDDEVKPE